MSVRRLMVVSARGSMVGSMRRLMVVSSRGSITG